MANINLQITLTEKNDAGPLFDVLWSSDCENYNLASSNVNLPTVGSTANVVVDSTYQCIKLVSKGNCTNFVVSGSFISTTTTAGPIPTTTQAPTTTTTTTLAPESYYTWYLTTQGYGTSNNACAGGAVSTVVYTDIIYDEILDFSNFNTRFFTDTGLTTAFDGNGDFWGISDINGGQPLAWAAIVGAGFLNSHGDCIT